MGLPGINYASSGYMNRSNQLKTKTAKSNITTQKMMLRIEAVKTQHSNNTSGQEHANQRM